jgi:hypothetical protein
MSERMNYMRLVRAARPLLLPFLILNFAPFAYSEERPSIFLEDLTWTELRDEIGTGKPPLSSRLAEPSRVARLWRSENTIGASSCFASGLQSR